MTLSSLLLHDTPRLRGKHDARWVSFNVMHCHCPHDINAVLQRPTGVRPSQRGEYGSGTYEYAVCLNEKRRSRVDRNVQCADVVALEDNPYLVKQLPFSSIQSHRMDASLETN